MKGSDYLRPFARIQEIIADAAATEATRMVEDDVPRSWRGHGEVNQEGKGGALSVVK